MTFNGKEIVELIFNDEKKYGYSWKGPDLTFHVPKSLNPAKGDEEYFRCVWEMFKGRVRTLNEFFEQSTFMYFEIQR